MRGTHEIKHEHWCYTCTFAKKRRKIAKLEYKWNKCEDCTSQLDYSAQNNLIHKCKQINMNDHNVLYSGASKTSRFSFLWGVLYELHELAYVKAKVHCYWGNSWDRAWVHAVPLVGLPKFVDNSWNNIWTKQMWVPKNI